MTKIKLILVSISLLIFIFILHKYKKYRSFIYNIATQADQLYEAIGHYEFDYRDDINNKRDVEKALRWYKKTYGKNIEIKNFNLKYDTINKIVILYSFGKDNKDDNLQKTPFNLLDSHGFYTFNNNSFSSFLFEKNTDIVFFSLKKREKWYLCNNYNRKSIPAFEFDLGGIDQLRIYNSLEKVSKVQKKFFYIGIYNLEKKLLKKNEILSKILFFRFKNGTVSNVCSQNVSRIKIKKLEQQLNKYFKSVDTTYFDYAFFPFKTSED